MNRNTAIACVFVLAAAGALGARFGLPAYAEYSVGRALDAHIAALPDPSQGAHSGLSLDYWNDRLELARLQLPVSLPNPTGDPMPTIITVEGITIDGYDLPALQTALATGAASAAPLISQVTWTGFTLRSPTADFRFAEGTAGRIDGISDLAFNPSTGAVTALSFDAMQQEGLTANVPVVMTGGIVLTGRISAISLSGVTPGSVKSVLVDGFTATGAKQPSETDAAATMVAQIAFDRMAIADWMRATGDGAGTLGSLVLDNVGVEIELPALPDSNNPLIGPIHYDVVHYELVNMRYDPFTLKVWQKLAPAMGETEPEPAQLAEFAEMFLTFFERAKSLDTGYERASISGLAMKLGAMSAATIDSVMIHDVHGLKAGRFEILGHHGTEPDGTEVRIAEYGGGGSDLSDLPDWARMVFGKPITIDSLAAGAAWADARPIGELIPDLDFGTFQMKGMQVTATGTPAMNVDLLAIDSMRITRRGYVEFTFRMEGIDAPLNGAPNPLPQVDSALQILRANGVEDVRLDMGLSLQASLTEGTGHTTVRLAGDDLADVSLAVDLTNVDFEKIRRTPKPQRSMVVATSDLAKMRLVLTDLGLRGLLLKAQAAERPGTNAETIGAQFGAMAEQTGASMGTDATRAIGQQLAAFITHGGSLLIETGLPVPLPITKLMRLQRQPPARIIETLGITATHTAP